MVTERQSELLLEEGRYPDADRIERRLLAQDESLARARRATPRWAGRWGSGGKHRAPVKDGLIVAAFRHHESTRHGSGRDRPAAHRLAVDTRNGRGTRRGNGPRTR
ncbi:hypothetical protein [Streptomyces sp. NPDC051132]|uniref:hypothetical protein n=1 Tax=unclassified Streptomyces TaxID=2593676 RepID=UPI00343D7893